MLYLRNYKNKLPRGYYNIGILLLILLILFWMSKSIFSKKPLDKNNNLGYETGSFNQYRNDKVDSDFFIKIVQHTFPNRSVQKQYKPLLAVKRKNKSFVASIFKIDFSNPLTFIQAQFPLAAAHHDSLIGSIPDNDYRQDDEDWTKEIHLVDYDEEKVRAVDKNIIEDGIGDILGAEDIVDSLNSISLDDLASIQVPKSIQIEKDRPAILIYHTHGTESYKPMTEGNYHSLEKEYTVIEVADVMSRELSKKGYKVIHDATYHDYPSYNGSYGRSVLTAKGILDQNPSIQIILDLHRDGYDKIDTRIDKMQLIENSRVKINNEYVARFQFVVGATSKNRREVETFAHFVKAISDKKYPGFSKEVLVKQYGSYNQYLSDYSALIELGSNANTIEEAKRAGYYLADVISDALDILSE